MQPIPPPRQEFQQTLLRPQAPKRMDIDDQHTNTISHQKECECNYNRYATKKTIGNGLLGFALITSNAMQLRTLIAQKQRDGIWVASLVLVCVSLILQILLAYLLVVVGKGNIQNPDKQTKLEKYNNLCLFLTTLISIINVIINVFMTSTNPNSFIDPNLLQSSKDQN